MSAISKLTAVVPVISKADTFTAKEMMDFKQEIMQVCTQHIELEANRLWRLCKLSQTERVGQWGDFRVLGQQMGFGWEEGGCATVQVNLTETGRRNMQVRVPTCVWHMQCNRPVLLLWR